MLLTDIPQMHIPEKVQTQQNSIGAYSLNKWLGWPIAKCLQVDRPT